MSMGADIEDLCQRAPKNYGLSNSQAADLYVSICNCLEWDYEEELDLPEDWADSDDCDTVLYNAVEKFLFGSVS